MIQQVKKRGGCMETQRERETWAEGGSVLELGGGGREINGLC